MNLKVVVEKGEDGYYVPASKGRSSQGKARDEAMKNIREAVELFFDHEV